VSTSRCIFGVKQRRIGSPADDSSANFPAEIRRQHHKSLLLEGFFREGIGADAISSLIFPA
jgi:hypothetical protein